MVVHWVKSWCGYSLGDVQKIGFLTGIKWYEHWPERVVEDDCAKIL